jgi:TolB-like protein
LIVAWLIAQIASIVLPTFEASPYIMKILLFVLVIGFPINMVFAWIYDVTPEGIKKTASIDQNSFLKNKRLNKVIVSALVFVVVVALSNVFFKGILNTSKSIAVLAFADMSPDKDQEYFSDGISEELLNLLAKTPDLRVISRTSSFSYKGSNKKVEEIGKELKVSHVLEGSVRKSGNTIRVTAQLINTNDGSHVWSEIYDKKLDDVLKVQDEIADKVTRKLQTTLGFTPTEKAVDPEAYNLYLKAKHLTHQRTKEAYTKAQELALQSIAIDSTYAPTYSLLSDIYYTGSYNFMTISVANAFTLGVNAAKKAIALDPKLAKAYINLASLEYNNWQFALADKNIKKALQLEPNNASIIGISALMKFGQRKEAIELIKKAIVIDPMIYGNYYNLGYYNFLEGNLNEAEEALNTFGLYNPSSSIYHYVKCMVFLEQGDFEAALAENEKEPHPFFKLYGECFAYFKMGKIKEADLALAELEKTYGSTEATNMADIYAYRGEIDTAFKWLNKAFEIKDPVLIDGLDFPSFKNLHKDPRWGALIAKLDLPKDHGYATN